MTLLLWHLLIPYGLFVLLFAAFAAMDIVHMVKFGTYTLANYFALVIFLAGTAFLLWGTSQLLAPVDWSQTVASIGADFFASSGPVGL
ncbi:MAG: hypothetical protein Q7R80_03675 [bacterium]|nr:hypothetical protein [bacterium]